MQPSGGGGGGGEERGALREVWVGVSRWDSQTLILCKTKKMVISLSCLRQDTFIYDPDSFRFVYKDYKLFSN